MKKIYTNKVKNKFNSNLNSRIHYEINHEKGAILVLSLLLIMVVTILGFSAFSSSFTEQKIVSNFEDKLRANEAAQTAALWAKNWLQQQCFKPTPLAKPNNNDNFTVLLQSAVGTANLSSRSNDSLWDSLATSLPFSTAYKIIPGLAAQPKVIIHELAWDPINQVQPYRIIARATGSSKNTVSFVVLYHQKYTPIPELGTRSTQGRGNLFNLKILGLPLTPPATPAKVDWYYIPGSYTPTTPTATLPADWDSASATPDPTRQWFMCIRDDGRIVFRPSGANVLAPRDFMQLSFLGLSKSCTQAPCYPYDLDVLRHSATKTATPIANNDYTTVPPEYYPTSTNKTAEGLPYLILPGYFELYFIHNTSGSKPVFGIRASNGLWLDLYGRTFNPTKKIFVKTFNNKTFEFPGPFSPIQSGYNTVQKFIIEITGDVNP